MCKRNEPEESFNVTKDGHTVTVDIFRDENPTNPRELHDCLGVLAVQRTSRYGWSDKHAPDFDTFRAARRNFRGVALWLILDSGDVREAGSPEGANAVLFATAERIRTEYASVGYTLQKRNAHARNVLKDEAETYGLWARGDVFGYVIKNASGGTLADDVGSCWGFYGVDYCREEATEQATYYVEREAQAAADYAARC